MSDAPDRPPTDEELAEAAKLRDALAGDPIAAALKAAWSPAPLDAAVHAQLINDLPTAEELELAALVDEDEMVHALKAAWDPVDLSAEEHRRIVERATSRVNVKKAPVRQARVFVVTTTVLALAAGVVLLIQTQTKSGGEVALAHVRSTQSLFDEPFKEGETSARIDKIAMARGADYRDNYFAKRGVR